MEIKLPNGAIVSADRKFDIEVKDEGGAKVTIAVEIYRGKKELQTIFRGKTHHGPLVESVKLTEGTYNVYCTIGADKAGGAMGPNYDSFVTMIEASGTRTELFRAKGTLTTAKPDDVDSDELVLKVS
jgi:hypothetical protein